MKTIHHYIAVVLGLVFLLFAYFQLDDADFYLWVPIYALAAAFSFAVYARKANRALLLVAAVIAFIGAFVYFPETYHGVAEFERYREVEYARESFGLSIIGLSMLYYYFLVK